MTWWKSCCYLYELYSVLKSFSYAQNVPLFQRLDPASSQKLLFQALEVASIPTFFSPLSEGQKLLCNLEISVSIPLRLTFFPHIRVISEPQCQSSEMED